MLFNYPKGDIYKFYDEVGDTAALPALPTASTDIRSRRMSVYNPNLMESVANINTLVGDRNSFMSRARVAAGDGHPTSGDNSQISKYSGEDGDGVRNSRRNSEYQNSSIAQGLNDSRSIPGGSARRNRRDSVARKVRANKVIPTNFQNKIGIWTDAIYERYGSDDQMNLQGFLSWAQRHQGFIMGFRKYFRYNLWKTVVNPKTNQAFLGYVTQTPVLQNQAEILAGVPNAPLKAGYAMLYADFLLVWPTDNYYALPSRVLILKNIRIQSDGTALTIEFSHESRRYRPLKLQLGRPAVWRFWKDTLEKYSRWPHQRQFLHKIRNEKQNRGRKVLVGALGAVAFFGAGVRGQNAGKGEAEGGRKRPAQVRSPETRRPS